MVKDIGLDNPIVYMSEDSIDGLKALVNATSMTILHARDRDPIVGYVHPHANLNQLWNDYLCALLFWNDRTWFQHCARLVAGMTADEDPDLYLDDDSSSVDDDTLSGYDSDETGSVADDE
jgi:hypothetical protein